jgi:hypothetical protein
MYENSFEFENSISESKKKYNVTYRSLQIDSEINTENIHWERTIL